MGVPNQKPRDSHTATSPEGVRSKISESRYFLRRAARLQGCSNRELFGFQMSAFMSAFRSAGYRLMGVVGNAIGGDAKQACKIEIYADGTRAFLIEQSNEEVHGNGPYVFSRIKVVAASSGGLEWSFRGPRRKRFEKPDKSKWPSSPKAGFVRIEGLHFGGNPEELISLCTRALDSLEAIVENRLSGLAREKV